jgi:hypothetical protein
MDKQITTLGGRVGCKRCITRSKRSGMQGLSSANSGKTCCRLHGGLSLGPKTLEGKRRCSMAKIIHGFETRQARLERSQEVLKIRMLHRLLWLLGMISSPRPRGRPPNI